MLKCVPAGAQTDRGKDESEQLSLSPSGRLHLYRRLSIFDPLEST